MNNKLLKKFAEFGIGNLLVLVSGFISSPIITRLIMPEEFGKFSMFNTVTSLFLFVLLLGLDQSYIRFFYEEDEEARSYLLRKSVKMTMIVNLVLSLIILLLSKPISNLIIGRYSIVLVISILIQNTFNILSKFSILVVRMKQKGKTYSFLQVIGRVFYILLIILTVRIFKGDYRTVVFASIVSNIIAVSVGIFIERKVWFDTRSDIELKTSVNEMLKFGIPLVFSMSITWLLQSIDKIFITNYSGYVELGIYSSAFTIVALLNAVQDSFITLWLPVANEKYKEAPNNTEFFTKINGVVSLGMLIIAILLITFKDILIIVLGPEYRDASFIFPFLVLMPIMFTISETTAVGINFTRKTKYHIYISIVAAICNLIGNSLLVPRFGARGAAIATGLSYLIFFACRTVISKKLYNVNYNIKRLILPLIMLTILAAYGSFNTMNVTLVGLGILAIIITLISYNFIVKEAIGELKKLKLRE